MSRVVLHVGAPKSGTTFLQRGLWARRDELLEGGLTCPGESGRDMFRAAIEVREVFDNWGFRPEELEGTWARLCREARAFPGTTVMSHELLAAATEDQVAAALRELEGVELHLVVTERDLARQVMSEWQERIKNGSTQTFEKFQHGVLKRMRDDPPTGLFWRYHDVPAVLRRWGSHLPAEQVHVVVAPPSGADPGELWRRFADAVGFDAGTVEPPASGGTANQTLGVTQIALLREVNEALDGRIPQPGYARFVKRQFAQNLLSQHRSARPVCPPELLEVLADVADEWCREIQQRGYRVHGDLAELLPRALDQQQPAPDEVPPQALAELSAQVVADLLVTRAREATRQRENAERRSRRAAHEAADRRLRSRVARRARGLAERVSRAVRRG